PIFSFAIKGKEQKEFLKDHSSCFGENSVYDMLYKMEGKYLLLGGCGHTLTHYAEERTGVHYRFHKKFSGILIDELGNAKQKEINFYVRKLDIHSLPDLVKINAVVSQTLSYKKEKFGNDFINIFNAKEYVNALNLALTKDKNALIEI
ncbi:AAC(3) family N-acetyltransferase, partial [Campylobacter novaezeelandiae]|uniref:AAC(3) family N-acetyltransferase n=1 Tax=Campylobacter novaezeelandiae TaxID=2267891 RepID=UPI001902E44C